MYQLIFYYCDEMFEVIDIVVKDLFSLWVWRFQKRLDGFFVWGFLEGYQMVIGESVWWSELFIIMSQEEQGGEDIGVMQFFLKCLNFLKYQFLLKYLFNSNILRIKILICRNLWNIIYLNKIIEFMECVDSWIWDMIEQMQEKL